MSIDKLHQCIEQRHANNSRAREAIYRLLLDAQDCLSVPVILENLEAVYPKKISQNTLYRHLGFFLDCKLAIAIQDNYKKAYYHLNNEDAIGFCVCSICNSVHKLEVQEYTLSTPLEEVDYITIHKKCNKCK